ncbi:MAG: hypothetical protein JKX85_09305 [Phycisphaeraceae bacterium]|nr:hypothetical protein [Phycisphaeraceae bacterium]
MDHTQAIRALTLTGKQLQQSDKSTKVTIIIGGSVAAMAVADMPVSRVTHDCDVLASERDDQWEAVYQAAQRVAEQQGLPKEWLNRDSRMYAHFLPVGWRSRCQLVGTFGPMQVLAISRLDLLAMKLMGAIVRPQDLEDMLALKPTKKDFVFLHKHLDRLDAESLTRETHDTERAILRELEASHG